MTKRKKTTKLVPTLQPEVALRLRTDFLAFVRKAYAWLNGDDARLEKEPYLEYLSTVLARLANSEIRRLLVNLPPRHLKTFVFSVCFPAWELLHRPSTKIMVVAGNAELVEKEIAEPMRNILRSSWFRELSRITLVRDQKMHFLTSAGGSVSAFSIDGSITGRGADLIILDDLVDIKAAANLERLEEVNERFDTVIESRLNNYKNGRMIVVAHRLHPNDLSGHLLKAGGWHHIVVPMVATEDLTYETEGGPWHRKLGDRLRPNAFTQEDVSKLRAKPNFYALYQQDLGGGIAGRVTKGHFGWFPRAMLSRLQLPVVLSVDPGDRGGPANSYSVIQAWCTDGVNYFLIDQFREQCGYKNFHKGYIRMVRRHNPSVVLIERTAQGSRLIDDVRGKPWPQIEPITPRRSKVARFRTHLDILLAERVKLPPGADWVEDVISECVKFPHDEFDDQVDAMTQALDYFSKKPELPLPPARGAGAVVAMKSHPPATPAKQLQKPDGQAPGRVYYASRGRRYGY